MRAALSLAKFYQPTGRTTDAHDVLGPALEGFSPTPEFPEVAEAKALFEALAETDAVKTASAAHRKRLQLQVAYGNALISARGYQAAETTEAFAYARRLATAIEDPSERFSVYYGLWAGSFVRGELAPMREVAQALLRISDARPELPEAGVAYRISGETSWFAGNFEEALPRLEQALAIFDPQRDRDLAFRFGQDAGVTAMAFAACVLWPLGQVDRAVRIAEAMVERADRSGHVTTMVWGYFMYAFFDVVRRNPAPATPHAAKVVELAREHGMSLWAAFGSFLEPYGRRRADDGGLVEMRRGLVALRQQGVLLIVPCFETVLAEIEGGEGQFDVALAGLDRAIVDIERNGQRWTEADAHRVRGEILLKQNPADPAPAEAAFLAAIAVAQQQKARSFELRAALSLAKLYRATGRDADARAALRPALEGFSPTPEFPEVGNAQALLAAVEADAHL